MSVKRAKTILFGVLVVVSVLSMAVPPYFTKADLMSLASALFSTAALIALRSNA